MSEVKSLLCLPEEILREIIRKVPRDHQRAVSESCKTLHEISCDVMFYTLNLTVSRSGFKTEINSLMTRRRRYEKLCVQRIYGPLDDDEGLRNLQMDGAIKVVKRFGNDVKCLSLTDLYMSESFVPLLNMMPNLKQIFIKNVECNAENIVELNLNKLKEIDVEMIYSEYFETLNQFKTLTPGVLRKLTIVESGRYNEELSNDVKFFPNQHNLDDLKINVQNYVVNLDYENLRLKSLRWHSNRSTDFEKIIRTQYGLKKLKVINDSIIEEQKIICDQLTSLEELHLRNANKLDVSEFADFSKLKVLKKLSLSFHYRFGPTALQSKQFNDCMTFLKSDSLMDLSLKDSPQLTEETIAQLAANLPQLKIFHKETYRRFDTELSAIMKNFPILDSLQYCYNLSYFKDSKKVSLHGSFNCESDFNEWLTYTRGDDVTEMELNFFTSSESQFENLAAHFPQVKILKIQSDPGNDPLGLILRSFPKVDSLIADSSSSQFFQYQDGFENDSLKKLSIKGQNFNEDFVKILGKCKKLEELTITGIKDANIFQGILEVQQNLKTLIVDSYQLSFSEAVMISLKTNAKNLILFDITLIIDSSSFSFVKIRDFIDQKFKKDFELIELRTIYEEYIEEDVFPSPSLRWKMSRLVSPPAMSNESYDLPPIPKKMKMSQ